jgi:NPCBM/NEW2 domain
VKTYRAWSSLFYLFPLISGLCLAATETLPGERTDARSWVAAKFEGQSLASPDLAYLLPQLKSGSLERNFRQGHGLKIGDKSFVRGIHCPSLGIVKVHLPGPGKRFRAEIGIDSNDISYYSSLGRGNVTVMVEVSGREVYRSAVLHEGLAAISIDVDLNSAADFTLHIQGVKAGVDWDQVDFADQLHPGSAFFICVRWREIAGAVAKMAPDAKLPGARRTAYRTHASLSRSQERARSALRRGGVPGLPYG